MKKQWKTLEELGFYPQINEFGHYVYDKKFAEIEIYSGGNFYIPETIEITQEIHKAVELKMIELGLWEE